MAEYPEDLRYDKTNSHVTALGRVLRAIRNVHGELLKEMGDKLEICSAHLSAIEHGRKSFDTELFKKLCNAYSLNPKMVKYIEYIQAVEQYKTRKDVIFMHPGLIHLTNKFYEIGYSTHYWIEKDILVTNMPSRTSERYLYIEPLGMSGTSEDWWYTVRDVVVRDGKESELISHMKDSEILETVKLYQL